MEQTFGNNYDLGNTSRFIRKWWKLITIVFIVAAIASLLISLLITPRYKSSAVLFPTDSNRGSKAILADRYSLDFMDYGIERDCEYAIQIMTSQSMVNDVCAKFNLMEHYGIPTDDSEKFHKLYSMYRDNVTVKRTDYLGIEISVLDVDPQWAADIANYIAANYDTISSRIQLQRATDAHNIMSGVCEGIQNDIYALEDSLRAHPQYANSIQQLISYKAKELAEVQTRTTQTEVDLQYDFSYKFMLDQAQPADKKAYPKRALITLLGAFGAMAVCILTLLLVDRRRKEEE
ncbi:MAG: Wzz/FepE/Etk N-terminal domain-containing protein [Bacteroidales bacterium]|nr:Wzz/FepE/Etk N-terminal domain-containing protein [Bacteroidales bacterium]